MEVQEVKSFTQGHTVNKRGLRDSNLACLEHPNLATHCQHSPLALKPSNSHQLALFNELNPYIVDATISIFRWWLYIDGGCLAHSHKYLHQVKKMPEKFCLADPSPFISSAERLHMRDSLQMIFTCTC